MNVSIDLQLSGDLTARAMMHRLRRAVGIAAATAWPARFAQAIAIVDEALQLVIRNVGENLFERKSPLTLSDAPARRRSALIAGKRGCFWRLSFYAPKSYCFSTSVAYYISSRTEFQ